MKAIVLAAGRGARMRPLTDSKPKAMIEIAGQTVIGRMLRSLIARGISDICVVTGYGRAQLEEHLRSSFPEARFTFVFNELYLETNNIYSMHLAFESFPIDDDVLLIESDLVFSESVLDLILESRHQNVAMVDKFKAGMDGTVVTLDDGLVTSIIPPHLQGPGFDFSDKYKTLNIYRFSREFAQTSFRRLLSFYATAYNDNCYYELILGILVYMQHEQIFACDVGNERWCELDDPNDVRLAEMTFDEGGRAEALDKAFGGFWNTPVVDFAFIRNMYFPNHSIFAELRYNLPALVQNYGSTQAMLNRKLATFLLVPESRVCLLNGLSQVYPMLKSALGERPGLVPEPTFGEYSGIFRACATYRDDGMRSLSEIPADRLAAAEVVVVVNPNSPTGSCVPGDEILALARREPRKLIVVDESFVDFSGQPPVQDLLEREALANVWVLKSLSKCLGAPGLRLGYVYSRDDSAIRELNARIPIWNSNSAAEYLLEVILKHRRALAESFRSTIADREDFAAGLAKLDVVERVYPSGANFLLVRLAISPARLGVLRRELLEGSNLYVKDCSSKLGDGGAYLRIAVRLPEENLRLVRALELAASKATPAR